MLERAGYDMREPLFVTARPAGFAAGSFRQQPCAQVTRDRRRGRHRPRRPGLRGAAPARAFSRVDRAVGFLGRDLVQRGRNL